MADPIATNDSIPERAPCAQCGKSTAYYPRSLDKYPPADYACFDNGRRLCLECAKPKMKPIDISATVDGYRKEGQDKRVKSALVVIIEEIASDHGATRKELETISHDLEQAGHDSEALLRVWSKVKGEFRGHD